MKDFLASIKQDEKFDSEVQVIEKIALDKIAPDPHQVRQHFDEEKLSELADSIKEHGIQNPIHVLKMEDGKYQILTGERRWRASQIAGLELIPCIVHTEAISDAKKRALQLIENLQRQDLGAIETAKGLESLREGGMGQREIARHLGLSEATVSKALTIIKKLPDDWIKEIESTAKTASIKDVYEIAAERNAQKRASLYQKLMRDFQKEVEVKVEEKVKKETEHKEFSEEDYNAAWENLKKVVRRDKSRLSEYMTLAKIQKLLEYTESVEE